MHTAVPLPGTLVWIRQRRWRVEHARLDRHVLRLDVANRDGRLTFLAPFDRPAVAARQERHRRVRRQRALAQLAAALARLPTARSLDAVVDARIDVLPHQLEPALALANGARRVLLADTVGAGKTIQAGLAIADLRRRVPAARILIAVPPALRDQWIDELRSRFDVVAEVADRPGLDHVARETAFGDNPWRQSQVWIASLDFLKQPHVLDALPAAPWDLFVVDEAHDACGASERHDACDAIAKTSRRVLLLTATPHSGDPVRFKRLIGLGALNDLDDGVTIFRRTRREISRTAERRVRWRRIPLTPAVRALFSALRGFETAVLADAGERRESALLFLSVLRKRATSTIAALDLTLERRLRFLDDPTTAFDSDWTQPRLVFDEPTDDLDAEDRVVLFGRVGIDAAQERMWLRRLRMLSAQALRDDPKVTAVVRALGRTHEPAVIFTEFRHSLEALQRRIERVRTVAILHGRQTPSERRGELQRFLNGSATVLLATDVASQGLNLQSRARWVISVELPWNPLRLEQRIGRVDRLGQLRPVHASLLMLDDGAESDLLARLARRVVVADRAFDAEASLPDEQTIGAALVTQTPLPVLPEATPLPLCGRWRRAARALAGRLRRRRALAACWRAPFHALGGRIVWRARSRSWGGACQPWLVLAVPLVDQHGVVLEQQAVVVQVPDSSSSCRAAEIVEAARAIAAARAAMRARRLCRIRMARLDSALTIDHAIARHLHAIRFPDEVQPGMFDHRVLRALANATTEAAEADDHLASERDDAAGDVRVGGAALIFDGRTRR